MADHKPQRLYNLATKLVNLVSLVDPETLIFVPVMIDVAATINPGTNRPIEPEHYHDEIQYKAITGVTVHKDQNGVDFIMLDAVGGYLPQANPETDEITWENSDLSTLKLRRAHHEAEKEVAEMKRREQVGKVETRFIGFCPECDMPMFAEISEELGRFECPCGDSVFVEIKPNKWAREG